MAFIPKVYEIVLPTKERVEVLISPRRWSGRIAGEWRVLGGLPDRKYIGRGTEDTLCLTLPASALGPLEVILPESSSAALQNLSSGEVLEIQASRPLTDDELSSPEPMQSRVWQPLAPRCSGQTPSKTNVEAFQAECKRLLSEVPVSEAFVSTGKSGVDIMTEGVAGARLYLGRGGGPLPAGDGFLCGLMAALQLRSDLEPKPVARWCSSVVAASAGRTHRISRSYLRAAGGGELVAPADELLASLFDEEHHVKEKLLDVWQLELLPGKEIALGVFAGFLGTTFQ